MNIVITMKNKVRTIDTTCLDLHSGILLEDDFLDISDYLNSGVLLERNVFLSTNDEMQTIKRAVALVEPDELDAVESITADGKPILQRTEDGSRLASAVFDVLYDEDGNFTGDSGRGLCLYYSSGSYETVAPTVLTYSDGMMASDDLIDWSDIENGITWTRGAWTRGDRNLMELRPEPTVVVIPEQYEHMELVTFQGALVAMRTADGLVSNFSQQHTQLTNDEQADTPQETVSDKPIGSANQDKEQSGIEEQEPSSDNDTEQQTDQGQADAEQNREPENELLDDGATDESQDETDDDEVNEEPCDDPTDADFADLI